MFNLCCKWDFRLILLALLLFVGMAVSHAAEEGGFIANMDLFIQDYHEPDFSQQRMLPWPTNHSMDENAATKDIKHFRRMAESAVFKKNDDSLKLVVDEAARYADSAGTTLKHVFSNSEIYILKFFLKDFAFLSNVDSLPNSFEACSDNGFCGALCTRLDKAVKSGESEQILNEVENESDRAFIRVVVEYLVSRDTKRVMEMMKQYNRQQTKDEHRFYLGQHFWRATEVDYEKFEAFSIGGGYVKMLGDVSKKVDDGFNVFLGIDWVRKGFFYEWFMNMQSNNVLDPDTLSFVDLGWDFNFGYMFVNTKYLKLYGFVTVGLGMDMLTDDGENDQRANADLLPSQFYPTYGAGFITDFFFTDMKGESGYHFGVRLRTGIKNIWADDLVKEDGYRWYVSFEFMYYDVQQKSVTFGKVKGG